MEYIPPKRQQSWRGFLGSKYNTVERFISYAHQLGAIESCAPHSVLEVGPGSTIISHHLRSMGYHVTTTDVDPDAHPDVLGDIRSLPLNDNTYDAVLAFQVLEHIPWEDFERALNELVRVSKKHLIISLPERSTYVEIVIKLPFIRSIFKRPFFDFWFAIPIRFPKGVSKKHHWETDFWQYSRKDIRKKIREVGTITSEFSPVLNKYHRFYIIEKNREA